MSGGVVGLSKAAVFASSHAATTDRIRKKVMASGAWPVS